MAFAKKKPVFKASADFSDMAANTKHDPISTGIIGVDTVMGGGYDPGDLILLWSASAVGKTTILLDMCKKAISRGKKVCYLDAERGVKDGILETMKLSDKAGCVAGECDFLILSPKSWGDIDKITKTIVTGPKELHYDLIILDSISALLYDLDEIDGKEIEDGFGQKRQLGIMAVKQSDFFKYLKTRLRNAGTTMFMVSQKRIKNTGKGGQINFEDAAQGGSAVEHAPDIRLKLIDGKKLVRKEDTTEGSKDVVYGQIVHITCEKNRMERSHIPIDICLIHGQGVSNYWSIDKILISNALCEVDGSGKSWKITGITGIDPTVACGGTSKTRNTYIKNNYKMLYDYLSSNGYLKLVRGVSEDLGA